MKVDMEVKRKELNEGFIEENLEIKVGKNQIKIAYKRNRHMEIKISSIECIGIDEDRELEEKHNCSINIANEESVVKLFDVFFSKLYNDLEFRNGLMVIDKMEIDEFHKEDRVVFQLYILIFNSLLKLIKSDSYFKFGFKNVYKDLLYKKFQISEVIYEKYKENPVYKEIYLDSYVELTTFIKENHNKLEDVEKIVKSVFYRETDSGYELKERFVENFEEVKEFIDEWFLMKSDYKSVDILLELNKRKRVKKTIKRKVVDFLFNSYTWLLCLYVPIIYYFLSKRFQYIECDFVEKNMWSFTYGSILIVIILNVLKFKAREHSFNHIIYIMTRRYYPRLLGGILTGFAILLVGDEVYKYVLNLSSIKVIAIAFFSLAITFIYLYSEISNNVNTSRHINIDTSDNEKCRIFKRTCRVFVQGLCHAYTLIYILNELVISGFLKGLIAEETLHIDCKIGVEGYYSKYMLINHPIFLDSVHNINITILYPILALMIGIFLQLLWEDKQITRPL